MNANNCGKTTVLVLFWLMLSLSLAAQGRGPGRGQPPTNSGGFLPGARREPPPEERNHRGEPPRSPETSFRFLSSDLRFNNKLVKGAPFSATAETLTVQPLMDGSRMTRKSTSQLYRDSEGRTRREQKLTNIGGFATADDAPPMVFIDDPVAGVSYMLDTKNLKARKMQFRGGFSPRGNLAPSPMRREGGTEAKTEQLGKQMIEGVEAEGTRTTITIPAGKLGNEKPLEIISERWYAPALQEVILSTHRDPRLGEHTYRLTNLNRSEPAATLFQPPSDYSLNENPRGMQPGGPSRRREDN